MKPLLTVTFILFLQPLFSQQVIYYELKKETLKNREKSPIIEAKDTVVFKAPPGKYTVEFIRPNNSIFQRFIIESKTGNFNVSYRPPQDYFYPEMWMYVTSGLYQKWYKVRFKIEVERKQYNAFVKAYQRAVKKGRASFMFKGNEFTRDYARSIMEYLEGGDKNEIIIK